MASLKEVRARIISVNSTQQITKAMKMVAAAKLRRAQDNITKIRPYSEKLTEILNNVSASLDASSENPYAEEREVKSVLIVLITSDRGLAGAFNTNAIKGALTLLNTRYSEQNAKGNVEILCIGKKGYEFFAKRGYKVNGDYTTLFTNLSFDTVRKAAEYVMDGFVNKKFDRVYTVYNEFKNVATQIVRSTQFLPPVKEVSFKKKKEVKTSQLNTIYIYEPSQEEIVTELIPKSLKIQFYKAVLDSNASEHGARMTAMDKATDNAKELLKELKLVYNRTRQAAITKEILEIVGGAEALKN
ncbi:MAG TPA: ATP synthase F1 subunit gamma [Cytophagaceae bacterium]|nr:ATP synthase F1 subunit gamma [Cytophagaceae bacterium]